MTWPSSDVPTTGMDAGTDTPPRSTFLAWAQAFNQMRNHVSTYMQGLLGSADASTARATLGATTTGAALFTAANAAAASTTLGATTTGAALFTAANAAAARTTLGATTTGAALFTAANAAAARTTLGATTTGAALFTAANAAAARMAAGVPNSGPLSGLRNLIINGNFSVNQRGYTSGTATTGANQYTLDRWRIVTSGQAATFATTGAGRTVTAPSGGIEQVIEGASIGGGTYVINWTGTASCTVNGVSRVKGATFTLTAGSNATVRFSSGTVTDVQIEPGEVATAFELRPAAVELMLCQRYFEAGSGYGWGQAGSAGNQRCACTPWKVTKRASPSVVTLNVAYTNSSGITAESADTSKSGYFLAVASGGYYAVSFDWTASAEL